MMIIAVSVLQLFSREDTFRREATIEVISKIMRLNLTREKIGLGLICSPEQFALLLEAEVVNASGEVITSEQKEMLVKGCDAWGEKLWVTNEDHICYVHSNGPDGRSGTSDDIVKPIGLY